jgi:hypothetical protein
MIHTSKVPASLSNIRLVWKPETDIAVYLALPLVTKKNVL